MFTPENVEKLLSLFTRDNITFVLSVVGSFGTAYTIFHNFVINRKNLNVRIIGHRYADEKSLLLYVAFENKSRLPISITGISVMVNSIWYSRFEPSIVVLEETTRTGKTVTSHHEFQNLPLPINLPSLGGTSGYVYFETPEANFQLDTTQLKFLINSNRGKVIEKKLSLGRHLD